VQNNHFAMPIVIVAASILCYYVSGCLAIAVSTPVPFSAGLNASESQFSIMTLTDNCEVIVAGIVTQRNVIYRLSPNLVALDSVTTSGTVRGLSLTNGGQYVMVCVDTDRSCSGYNVTDFNDILSGIELSGSAASEDDPVGMFPGEAEGDVYVGTAAVSTGQYPMMLGQYSITGGSIVTDRTRDYDISTRLINERIFHTGFVLDDYAYYIVGDGGNDIRILRVCNQSIDQLLDTTNPGSQLFRAIYQVELVCGGSVVFAGASVVQDYPNPGNNTLVLAVRSVRSSVASQICTYSISDINTAMDNSLSDCADNSVDRRTNWDESDDVFDFGNLCTASTVSTSSNADLLYHS